MRRKNVPHTVMTVGTEIQPRLPPPQQTFNEFDLILFSILSINSGHCHKYPDCHRTDELQIPRRMWFLDESWQCSDSSRPLHASISTFFHRRAIDLPTKRAALDATNRYNRFVFLSVRRAAACSVSTTIGHVEQHRQDTVRHVTLRRDRYIPRYVTTVSIIRQLDANPWSLATIYYRLACFMD